MSDIHTVYKHKEAVNTHNQMASQKFYEGLFLKGRKIIYIYYCGFKYILSSFVSHTQVLNS